MFVFKRSHHNPILVPTKEHLWESLATFNWCPVKDGRTVHAVYRAEGTPELVVPGIATLSTIGYAKSLDGFHFKDRRPFIRPQFDWEKFGCEDPRVTKLDGKYYIFYTALSTYPFGASGIKVAAAVTRDFKTIDEKHLVTPFNAKAMALFPERIKGKLCAVLTPNTDMPPARIALARFDKEEEIWSEEYWKKWYAALDTHAYDLRRSGGDQVEVGAPPVKTSEGWLLIYSHIQNYFGGGPRVFGIEAVLLDLENPERIIARTKGPFLVPEEIYEQFGRVPDIVFPSGAYVQGKKLRVFYGASDTTCAAAEVNLEDFIDSLIPEREDRHVRRFSGNPILTPDKNHPWEAKAVFNPAAIELDGKIHLLYRAMDHDNTSVFGYAVTKDGVRIDERLDRPVYVPREAFEMKTVPGGNSGCEDPRIVRVGDRLYVTYTAYDGTHLPAVAATSISTKDFLARRWNWAKPVIITPLEVDDKDSCIFPEKIGDHYVILHRIGVTVCADFIKTLDFAQERLTKCIEVLRPRPGMWDSKKVGLAAPPIKTPKGWLVLYHGISEHNNYRVSAALLDLGNPTLTVSRITDALLWPAMEYEMKGQVPNVVFPCGAVARGDTLFIYYGGADSVVAVATMKLSRLLKALAG